MRGSRSYTARMRIIALALAVLAAAAVSAQPAPRLPAETLLDRAVLTALDEELSGVAAKDHVGRLDAAASRARLARLSRGDRVRDGAREGRRPQRRARRDVSRATARPGSARCTATAAGASTADGSTKCSRSRGGSSRTTTCGSRSPTTARAPTSRWSSSTSAPARSAATTPARTCAASWCLCDATPSACHRQAVEELGAAGLVSYNSNQVSAWWRDDQDLIRWGHLDARGRRNTFAIMISVREARALQQRLARGEHITLHAVVRARNDDAMPLRDAGRDDSRHRPGGRRHRLQLPPRSREARRQRQRQRLRRQPRDRAER